MPITDLIPWKRQETAHPEEERALQPERNPFLTFQQEMNRLFDQFYGGFDLAPFGLLREEWGAVHPRVDAVETDKAIKVSVELPGLSEKDVEVSLSRDVLTVSGKKTQRREEKRDNYFRSERSYGAFKRSIALPCEVEVDQVDAVFRHGVLTINLPKAGQAPARRRVAIKAE